MIHRCPDCAIGVSCYRHERSNPPRSARAIAEQIEYFIRDRSTSAGEEERYLMLFAAALAAQQAETREDWQEIAATEMLDQVAAGRLQYDRAVKAEAALQQAREALQAIQLLRAGAVVDQIVDAAL